MRPIELTRLQFLVLDALKDGERAGRGVREELRRAGHDRSGPAFYQLMARMEDAGLVSGRYFGSVVNGQPVTERAYVATAKGGRAHRETIEFYLARATRKRGDR